MMFRQLNLHHASAAVLLSLITAAAAEDTSRSARLFNSTFVKVNSSELGYAAGVALAGTFFTAAVATNFPEVFDIFGSSSASQRVDSSASEEDDAIGTASTVADNDSSSSTAPPPQILNSWSANAPGCNCAQYCKAYFDYEYGYPSPSSAIHQSRGRPSQR